MDIVKEQARIVKDLKEIKTKYSLTYVDLARITGASFGYAHQIIRNSDVFKMSEKMIKKFDKGIKEFKENV